MTRNQGAEAHVMAHVRLRLAAWGWNASGLSKELKKAQAAGVGKGTSQQALSDLLADRPGRRLSLDQVVAIAFVLDIPMADIVQDPDALTDPIVRSEFDALASARNDLDLTEAVDVAARAMWEARNDRLRAKGYRSAVIPWADATPLERDAQRQDMLPVVAALHTSGMLCEAPL